MTIMQVTVVTSRNVDRSPKAACATLTHRIRQPTRERDYSFYPPGKQTQQVENAQAALQVRRTTYDLVRVTFAQAANGLHLKYGRYFFGFGSHRFRLCDGPNMKQFPAKQSVRSGTALGHATKVAAPLPLG